MKLNFIIPFAIAVSVAIGGCAGNQKNVAANNADSIKNAANNWAILPFTKIDSVNPILGPGRGKFIDPILKTQVMWEAKDVFNPAIVNRAGKIWMLYRAQDTIGKPGGTSRIGLAVSTDALHFVRKPTPVLYPDKDDFKKLEWQGGCEDPRVVEDGKGTYYMTYTAFDGTVARLLVATSTDLIKWKKYGSVFAKTDSGKYADKWSKSGSIVSTYKSGRVIATKINDKYWMYWGDTQIWTATSTDLINWTPVKMATGEHPPVKLRSEAMNFPELKIALPTREGKFDSDLVEPGPPAILTDKGIVLIYNSRNVPSFGDKTLAEGTYAASQAMFDKDDPTKLIKRLDTYFMKPEKPYEISGQVNQVCFVEGLTQFENKWYLYYGTADSKIAVAVSPVK
ncbi:glycoside hydrolase family 130 protein [Mucilaginibacter sabulilitoris]|uniref:Glycoside hydrolase family 130 protein n=1 Tax=Mucilaginibacter sabulilitoris TaxID=1173583 RepID=A0ABZ0TQ29_9SPHI|nr:glycoside hydrolase family 130 protein [Mucilaginibacter sabulilitoris]WPU94881.1 glycoside hydrolase family 130 protein [Mucilaginibacter sabulilitoris]